MKLFKRIVSLVLCLLLLSSGTFSVLASAAPLACPKCGGTESHAEDCELGKMAALFGMPFSRDTKPTEESSEPSTEVPAVPAAVECETCGAVDCTSTHENWCEICKKDDCGQTHAACDKCGTVDCQNTHETWCDVCKKDDCGQTHAACDKCGTVDCQNTHETWCDVCKKDDCGQTHAACDKCGTVDCQNAHENWCDVCKKDDCGQTHTTEPEAPAGPQVGDKIWIKSGSLTYKDPAAGDAEGNSRDVLFNYETTIESIVTDESGKAVWYEFKPSGLLALFAAYKYVAVESTTTEKPDDSTESTESKVPACDCEYPPESGKLSDHVDGCARKAYVKSLLEGKTAEEIHANWESYDEELKADILVMLEVYDKTKLEALNKLIEDGNGTEIGESQQFEVGNINLSIQIPEGAFPEGTTVDVKAVTDVSGNYIANLNNVLSDILSDYSVNPLSTKVMDISFSNGGEEVQPQVPVLLTFDVPVYEMASGADVMAIFHVDDGGKVEMVAMQNVQASQAQSITIEADSFSHYAVLQSETTYNPVLMRTKLNGNPRYSIVEFPVTLNDFDAEAYNNAYGSSGLWFTTGTAGTGMNLGALPATQGIAANNLSPSGYPVTAGEDRGPILFSPNAATGKTPHANVGFEFIYDNQTGYYTYNSGANHAQYHSSDNTVKLYADTLAPFNYRYDMLSKITANGNYATKTNSNGNVKITVNTATGNNMFRITDGDFTDLDSDNYTHMYLRLKSTFGGTIKCRVFYSDSDYDTYSVALQEDKWADYIFGPFDTGKTVRYARFYIADAAAKDSVEIDTAGVLQTDNSTEVNFAGLYPFNTTLTTTYSGSEKFDMSTWESLIQSGNNHKLFSSRVMNNTPFTSNSLADDYVYFSMAMEVDFYIPADGKVNGEEIVFKFNGDDDMWVFVDGQLALDIGGAHTDVAGSINFTTGATHVDNVRSLTDTTVIGNGAKNDKLYSGQYAAGKYHKLKVFYMERAGTNSNCLIKFNLPVVPTGDVVVSKNIVEDNGNEITSELADTMFEFTAKVGDSAYANKSFTVVTKNADGTETKRNETTDASGNFTLKHNQTAYFDGINEGSTVTITEAQPVDVGEDYKYKNTKVNGALGLSKSDTTSANGIVTFEFENIYERTTTEEEDVTYIVVEKIFKNLTQDQIPVNDFEIIVKDSSGTVKATLTLDKATTGPVSKDGGIAYTWKVEGLDAGTYNITETGADVTNYEVTVAGTGNVTTAASNMVITEINSDPSCNDKVIELKDKAGNKANVDIIIADLTEDAGYFVWTRETLSGSQRKAVAKYIGGNKEVSQDKLFFYSGEKLTDEDGMFFRGASIRFDMENSVMYFSATKQWTKVRWGTYAMEGGQNPEISVTNQYELQIADLVIRKAIQNGENPDQSFVFRVEGDGVDMVVTIAAKKFVNGEASVTVTGLKAGITYKVTELTDWSWRYEVVGSEEQGITLSATDENIVTFTNRRDNTKWLDGEHSSQNVFTAAEKATN